MGYKPKADQPLGQRNVEVSIPLELASKMLGYGFNEVKDYIYKLEDTIAQQAKHIKELEGKEGKVK